ncbi:MAG: orotate phosphoribosyltransferase [Lachnospiraceae bacterium]|nr:orotate phosphoribosyltransferase [Lachnospiraceae bacterium]
MENTNQLKIYSKYNNLISLNVTPGHFATSSSHINYYIDITTLKTRSSEAKEVAKAMVQDYVVSTVIDTIICLDGTDIIGAYLADELTSAGFISANTHKTIYILQPEQNSAGQLLFRENNLPMIRGKNVLVLLASASTGKTLKTALECIEYYGGSIAGVSSIFSAATEIHGVTINSIFTAEDVPGYATYGTSSCPLCKGNHPINAIVNRYGYAKL